MAKPTNRQEFAEKCLRALGKPVTNINVTPDQVDDRIDQALQYFTDYHFDATEKIFYKHELTQADFDNRYITIPENIMGMVRLFPIGSPISGTDGLFNIHYQIALNDLYTLTSTSMVPFYMAMQHLRLLEELIVGEQPIRYNRHNNRLHIDGNWDKLIIGTYILIEAYQVIDPDEFSDVWSDRWLFEYATQLIKQQWGTNTKKFQNMKLVGGTAFNGQIIYDEATRRIAEMEDDVLNSYSIPVVDIYG